MGVGSVMLFSSYYIDGSSSVWACTCNCCCFTKIEDS